MTSRAVIERERRAISTIRPFLALSGIAGAVQKRALEQFTCVINCIAGVRHDLPPHLTVLHIPIEDEESTDLTPYWQLVFETIDEQRRAGGKVLVYCGMGISRSAALVLGYLVCIEGRSLLDAYKHVQRVRNVICPNIGFFKQLIELEYKLHGKKTVRVIEPIGGVQVADVVWTELYEEVISPRGTR